MQKVRTGARGISPAYTSRAERLADGSLVDMSKQGRAHRFVVPVALTRDLYRDVCDLSGEYVLSSDTPESRLTNLLYYARAHASHHLDESGFPFSLYLPVGERTTYKVWLSLHAGDDLENVITISKQ